MKFAPVLVPVLTVIVNCAANNEPGDNAKADSSTYFLKKKNINHQPVKESTAVIDNELDEFIKGNHQFTADLYKKLIRGRQDKNFVFSPLTIAIALGIARLGANGKSADEITKTVGLPKDDNDLLKSVEKVADKLKSDEFKLSQAVGLYTDQDVIVTDSFKTKLEKFPDAKLNSVDFKNISNAVANINRWVQVQTKHKIKGLLSEDDISKTTQLVLINAVYFSATWQHQFTMLPTKKRFRVSRTKSTLVEMMTVTNYFRYYDLDHIDAKAIELPYEGKDASMVIVLPNKDWGDLSEINSNLAEVIEITTADCKTKCSKRYTTVEMPIFHVWARYPMQSDLNELGIKTPFSNDADFKNMASGSGTIKLQNVVQKAFINVTTEGTVAAAASEDKFQFRFLPSMRHMTPDPTLFSVNHGFVYYIKLSNTVIMAGKTTHMT